MSFIIWKDFYRENWLIFLGNWGEATLVLRIWGAKENYFQGAEDFFQGYGEINALFLGIKGAQTPLAASSQCCIGQPMCIITAVVRNEWFYLFAWFDVLRHS